jgi:hypothetical protein
MSGPDDQLEHRVQGVGACKTEPPMGAQQASGVAGERVSRKTCLRKSPVAGGYAGQSIRGVHRPGSRPAMITMYVALAPISSGDEQRWIGLPSVIDFVASCGQLRRQEPPQ